MTPSRQNFRALHSIVARLQPYLSSRRRHQGAAILHQNQNKAHQLWYRSQPRLFALPDGLYAVGSIHHGLLATLNRFIASNKTGAKPGNFQFGESIVHAQPLPACFHDQQHRSSNGNGFTPRQTKARNIG